MLLPRGAEVIRGRRRVVVTGMGIVSCLGVGVEHVWTRLVNGESGITRLLAPEFKGIPCQVGGLVPCGDGAGELNLEQFVSRSEQKTMSLASAYALVATHEALRQSNWSPVSDEQKCRTGVAVGMGMVGMDDIVSTGRDLAEKGYKRVSPHFVPRILTNMAAGLISLKYGFKGVNHAVSTACATGLHAIGDASRFITHNDVDVMICGGTEACLGPVALAGFSRMRALSTRFNEQPTQASRPFDSLRDGFVMSEGAGVLVLEELNHAQARGATILAEVLGYGLSGDVAHITAPSEDGDGAFRCMLGALRDAGLQTSDIGHINAHATSTPLGDAAEARAFQRLFTNTHSAPPLVCSTKGSIGHLLGAAGSVETIFSILSCSTGVVPPTLNCNTPDITSGQSFQLVQGKSEAWPELGDRSRRIALTNSFGFGGTNVSLCVATFR